VFAGFNKVPVGLVKIFVQLGVSFFPHTCDQHLESLAALDHRIVIKQCHLYQHAFSPVETDGRLRLGLYKCKQEVNWLGIISGGDGCWNSEYEGGKSMPTFEYIV
jgi:hypothetical protein